MIIGFEVWHNTVWKVSKYDVFSGPYFPVFQGSCIYSVNVRIQFEYSLRIQSECEKIRTMKNSIFWHFWRSVTTRKLNYLSMNRLCFNWSNAYTCTKRSITLFCKQERRKWSQLPVWPFSKIIQWLCILFWDNLPKFKCYWKKDSQWVSIF